VVQVEHEIADPAFIVPVAEAAGDLIGFAMAIPMNGELRAVYVRPNWVGGVGRALLAEIERRAFALAEQLVCDASLNAEEFYKAIRYQAEAPIRHVLRRGAANPLHPHEQAATRIPCNATTGRCLVGQLCQCRAHPRQILNQRSSTRLLLGRDAGPECLIADCAGGVVEPDAISVEASLDGRLIDAEHGVEHVLAADIEKQIAKIVVPIRPGGAAVVEDAVDCIGLIERQVVKA
jgi:hypothetical protein